MMQTDVKSAHLSSAGTVFAGPARLKSFVVVGAAAQASTIQFRDGGSGGPVLVEFDVVANTNPNAVNVLIPGEGVRFNTSIYFASSGTITGMTAFYG
jgi:hypothetical protein